MSDLSAQLSAFKSRIRNGPSVVPKRFRDEPPVKRTFNEVEDSNISSNRNKNIGNGIHNGEVTFESNGYGSSSEKIGIAEAIKRHKANLSNMPGSHLATQLHLAVEFIKHEDKPVSIKELRDHLQSVDITETLIPLLKDVDRIRYNPDIHLFEYASLHDIKSSESLLAFLNEQGTFKGIPVKELKDGWPNCLKSISELEQEDKILVLRTKKENAPRLIWINKGGNLNLIDDEFKTMWNQVRIPEQDELYKSLIEQSLKPTGADPNIIKRRPNSEEKKQKKVRRGKITNTHMKGILKDYSQL